MADQQNQSDINNEASRQEPLRPEWTKGDSDRSGQSPRGFRLRNLEFGAKGVKGSPTLESIGLQGLIGATAFENADLKANHTEPGALTGMLAETMSKLEEKYHSGAYDAAAMPLVEQYLNEMHNMASIQLDRFEIIAERVSDIKEANEAAYKAVCEVREQREASIRESSAFIQDELTVERFRRAQRRQAHQEAKDKQRLMRDLERIEKLTAKRQSNRAHEETKAISEDGKAREASMRLEQQESLSKTKLAQEELRRIEVLSEAKRVELVGARAAAETAEVNLARARTEIAEQELREKQTAILEEMRQSVSDAKRTYEEQISAAKSEVDEFLEQARLAAAEREAKEQEAKAQESEAADTREDVSQAQIKPNEQSRSGFFSKLKGMIAPPASPAPPGVSAKDAEEKASVSDEDKDIGMKDGLLAVQPESSGIDDASVPQDVRENDEDLKRIEEEASDHAGTSQVDDSDEMVVETERQEPESQN